MPPVSPRQRIAGLAAHGLTASGIVLGFLALIAALEDRYAAMFVWLALALALDGVDGSIARRAEVTRTAPEFSGVILDLVIDYVTWVLVPAYALYRAGLLPPSLNLPLTALILLVSVLYFADTRMKTADWYFRGFPGAWNVFAFLVFVFRPDPWIAAVLVLALCGLTFAPVTFVHPLRVVRFRTLNLALLAATAVLVALALAWNLDPPPWVRIGLGAAGTYFLLIGLIRPRQA